MVTPRCTAAIVSATSASLIVLNAVTPSAAVQKLAPLRPPPRSVSVRPSLVHERQSALRRLPPPCVPCASRPVGGPSALDEPGAPPAALPSWTVLCRQVVRAPPRPSCLPLPRLRPRHRRGARRARAAAQQLLLLVHLS